MVSLVFLCEGCGVLKLDLRQIGEEDDRFVCLSLRERPEFGLKGYKHDVKSEHETGIKWPSLLLNSHEQVNSPPLISSSPFTHTFVRPVID